jgi:hypothetical protein
LVTCPEERIAVDRLFRHAHPVFRRPRSELPITRFEVDTLFDALFDIHSETTEILAILREENDGEEEDLDD